jgi:hypothetical protein
MSDGSVSPSPASRRGAFDAGGPRPDRDSHLQEHDQ